MRESWKITSLLIIAIVVLSFIAYRGRQRSSNVTGEVSGVSVFSSARTLADVLVSSAAVPAEYPRSSSPATERDKRIASAMAKYGNRPVVLDFMEDLKNDPCTAKIIADRRLTNMFDALSAAREAGCLDRLKLKYAFRPQFIKLMAEIMSDPEVRPLLESGASPSVAPPVDGN
jgi:hypothetical protein